MALSGFADPRGFTENLAYMHFALILTFLFLLSVCPFPLTSVFISPFSSFFLSLPFADSFCLCDLPHFIQPVCSYRNRVFGVRLFVHACSHNCSCFLSSSSFWTTFKQYVREGRDLKFNENSHSFETESTPQKWHHVKVLKAYITAPPLQRHTDQPEMYGVVLVMWSC